MRSATPAGAVVVGAAALLACAAVWQGATSPPRCSPPPGRDGGEPVALVSMFDGAGFEKPVQALEHPADPATWFVADARGIVWRVRDGAVTTFLDISGRVLTGEEWGLQAIALAPGFPSDSRVFAAYTAAAGAGVVSRVSVFDAGAGAETIEAAGEVELLSEAQEAPEHAIAGLAFGPDGYLYVGWGEGGTGNDPAAVRGKMLRLDVGSTRLAADTAASRPYTVPADNPFVGTNVRPEAYATGLRNPWRFSFDRETGALWVADVGGHTIEEIDRVVRGGHYGWPDWEGTSCRLRETCLAAPGERPVHEHTHDDVCAIIGGYVYRGRALPALRGKYVYGDNCTGTIWALDVSSQGAAAAGVAGEDVAERPAPEVVARARRGIGSFAEDRAGELYVVETEASSQAVRSVRGGYRVRKLVAGDDAAAPSHEEPTAAPTRSSRLSDTGCIASGGFRAAPPGTIAYRVNQPAWADGAETLRFAKLAPSPPVWGTDVELLSASVGTILVKTYVRDERPIETQMLVRRHDGSWDAHDYRWNEEGTDAIALAHAETASFADGQTWLFPGPDGCAACHNGGVGMTRALTVSQLNAEVDGRNQIARLEALGLLVWPWKGGVLGAMSRPDDASVTIDERARDYLHVNCAHCHQPAGGARGAAMDLRRETPLEATGLCGRPPSAAFPGHEDALLVAPGEPRRSLLAVRAGLDGPGAMPPHRRKVDVGGLRLLEDWIRSLASCESGPT